MLGVRVRWILFQRHFVPRLMSFDKKGQLGDPERKNDEKRNIFELDFVSNLATRRSYVSEEARVYGRRLELRCDILRPRVRIGPLTRRSVGHSLLR